MSNAANVDLRFLKAQNVQTAITQLKKGKRSLEDMETCGVL